MNGLIQVLYMELKNKYKCINNVSGKINRRTHFIVITNGFFNMNECYYFYLHGIIVVFSVESTRIQDPTIKGLL